MSFDATAILSEIDAQIAKLTEARTLLAGVAGTPVPVKRGPGRPPKAEIAPKTATKRVWTEEGKQKIREAQRARWAKSKKGA